MMISKQKVQHIAKLARIKLTEREIQKFQKDLSAILDYFASLKEVDVFRIEPTFHPTEYFFKKKPGIMREDKSGPQRIEVVNKLIEAVPERKRGYIKVKAIF